MSDSKLQDDASEESEAPALYRHIDEMEPWDDRLQVLEVIAVSEEAPEVRTFTFRSDNQTWFRYKPGQFVTLELPVDADTGADPIHRTYTLSSSPSRPFSIAVTVKAQPGSIGTRWMFDNLKPGDRLRAYGPAGNFSHHDFPAAKYLFLSAGSGVTPMMSMLRWLNDCAPWTDVAFVNCARRPEEIIFRKELELLGDRMPGLDLGFLVEERTSRVGWSGPKGRIDAARFALLAPDFAEREIFCCGPEPFMRAVREILQAAGFDMAHYHEESFTAPQRAPLPDPETLAVATGGEGATDEAVEPGDLPQPVSFVLSEVEAVCLPGQSLLQTARASGVRIPAACEFGLCGTCKVRKRAGAVEMAHNGGILDHEIEEGYVLACCSRPLGAVEIEA